MFTGLVESTATVRSLATPGESASLVLEGVAFAEELALGESVAVNGCCLTVVSAGSGAAAFDLLQQTLRLTSLGALQPGSMVNLERAMTMNARLGGHMVQGHVDGTGTISRWEPSGQDYRLEILVPAALMLQIIPQGSITVDGISLTVAERAADRITCWVTPHTRAVTHLHHAVPGQPVNLETDLIGKYVTQYMRAAAQAAQGTGT